MELGNQSNAIDSLLWLPAKRIVQGLPYDEPTCQIYPLKVSLGPYEGLLRASGMNVLHPLVAPPLPIARSSANHGDSMLRILQQMKGTEDQCDLTISLQDSKFYVHRMVLACFSSYFLKLVGPETWKESRTGNVNVDSTPFATPDSVTFVVDWVYSGCVNINDDIANLDIDSVDRRLNHYLDVLQLTDYWDIPLLKAEMENFILRHAVYFIRVENVRAVGNIAEQCNAAMLLSYCQSFEDSNKEVVEMINSVQENIEEPQRRMTLRGCLMFPVFLMPLYIFIYRMRR